MLDTMTVMSMDRAHEARRRIGDAVRALILAELVRRERAHEPPPTLAELAALTGQTTAGAQHHVNALARAGLVHRGPGARWLVLTDAGRAMITG